MRQRSTQLASDNRGFTIIEMIVVISIFAILAGLVLFRYKDYTAEINLENTTQDIALQIQQAENYAIAGRYPSLINQTQIPPTANWRPSYGVYFDTVPANNNQKKILFFFDRESVQPGDQRYKDPGIDGRAYLTDSPAFGSCGGVISAECLNAITITNDVSISKICTGTMAYCSNTSVPSLGTISIVFTRPFPDVLAFYNVPGGLGDNTAQQVIGDIRIRVKSDTTGKSRDIVISSLGQIHIESVQ